MMLLSSFSQIKRFVRNDRGAIAIQFGLVIVPMVALSGIAIDYSKYLDVKGQLQQVADSSAIAGARLPATSATNRYDAAQHMLQASLTASKLEGVTSSVQASNANVRVEVNYAMKTSFMNVMGVKKLDIKLSTAAQSQVENGGVACMLALNETSPDGLHLQGINKVSSRNCWTWVNSNSSTAINAVGAAMGTGQGFCSHGGSSGAGHFQPQPYRECDKMEDPFQSKFHSWNPANYAAACKETGLVLKGGNHTLEPGVYCGNTVLKPQANVTMTPGTYIFRDGYLEVQGQSSLTGQGVSLFFVGSNTKMTVRGGGSVVLKAPTEGDLAGFVIIDRKYSWSGIRESEIQGGGRVKIEGVMYVPQWKLNVGGNGEMNQEAKYTAIVADTFYMEGNGKLYVQSDAAGAGLPDLMPRIKNGPRLLY